jgi:parallel beta-helix repeat protein
MARLRTSKGLSILVALAVVLALGIVAVPTAGTANNGNGDKGSFDILVFENGNWQLQGELSFSDYETRGLPLDNDAGQVRIKLVQHGHDGAYVDYVALQKDSVSYLPAGAINVNSNTNILNKIISPEYDVCDAWDSALEIVWDNVPASATLVMRAMEEDLGIGHGGPLYYPNIRCGETLSYTLVADGGITVDGVVEESKEPDFTVFWQPDSPHPDGYTYGWLHCDEDYLYAAVEVTADNTPDEEDWGALYVMVDGAFKEFRISCDDNQWGTNGFQYTRSVVYEHRIYEFQIPLSEMNARIGDEIDYGFGCYGTVAIQPYEVWVDDDWVGLNPGDPADGHIFGRDAFAAIQPAIGAVHEEGIVRVRPGKYNETLLINKSLTLQSTDGWEDTTIDPVGDSIIRIEGDADVTVQGFEITAGSCGISIGEVFSTVNVLDCFIHGNQFDGIRVLSPGDVLNIERNIISDNGKSTNGCGINMRQAWNTTNIVSNVIGAWAGLNSPSSSIGLPGNGGDGIHIDDVPVGSHVAIEDNLIVGNGDDGIDFPSEISVHGSVDIEDNVIGAWVYDLDVPYIFDGNHKRGIHVAHVSDTGRINIEGNAISQNWDDGINFGSGVNAIYGTVTIVKNLIGAWTCYDGDYGYSGSPQRYYGNRDRGIEIKQVGWLGASGRVTIEGNKISENHRGEIDETGIYIEYIYGVVTIEGNDIGSWTDRNGASYLGNNGAGILVANVFSGAELTIGPDNSIKNNLGDGIAIGLGEASSDIEIHHNQIDANGGKDLRLGGLDQIIIEGCGIKLGSGGVCGAIVSDNIITNHHEGVHLDEYSRNTIVQNNEIRDNAEGIWIEGDNNQILRNDILNNKGAPASGIHLTSTALGNIMHCNNIEGNLPWGVYNDNADETVDAISNWWGDASGPSAVGPGSGDAVSENVNYSSWLSSEFQYCRECQGLPAPAVPTVNHWGIVAMITLFAGLLVWTVRRRRAAS